MDCFASLAMTVLATSGALWEQSAGNPDIPGSVPTHRRGMTRKLTLY
jgi:hypothetical protein